VILNKTASHTEHKKEKTMDIHAKKINRNIFRYLCFILSTKSEIELFALRTPLIFCKNRKKGLKIDFRDQALNKKAFANISY